MDKNGIEAFKKETGRSPKDGLVSFYSEYALWLKAKLDGLVK